MMPKKFEHPTPTKNLVFFHLKERNKYRGTIKVYSIGIDYVKMKAVILDGLTHVGMVPQDIPYCKNMDELILLMRENGWSLVKD